MNAQINSKSNIFIFIATVICVIGGLANIFDSVIVELAFSGVLIVLIGLPHGATDLLLFKHLVSNVNKNSYVKFFSVYLGLIMIYGMIWLLFPEIAFLLFIIVSIYHFGQSNWNFIKVDNAIVKILMYLLSGSFVLLSPLCLHYETTIGVITGITGVELLLMNDNIILFIPRTLLILNIWTLFYLYSKRCIDKNELLLQISSLILLMVMYYSLPLILGFTVYFVFWHSYGSMIDQFRFIKSKSVHFTWFEYSKNALPFTVIAILFIIFCVSVNYYFEFGYTLVQIFFVILSLFTLPHILLIEQVYGKMDSVFPQVSYN